MTGRTVVITGGNSGIGKATALVLARAGARTVVVSRSPDRGRAAVEELRRDSGSERVELVLGDLGSLGSTRDLAGALLAACPELHVLVNNAGVWLTSRQETADGYEQTFAVNHLAPFLLTNLLLERLAASRARVVNVSSAVHHQGRVDFDDLQVQRRSYSGLSAYADSKLMNVLFTRELARRTEGTGVTTNALHPGVVATNFGTGNSRLLDLGLRIVAPLIASPERGARTSVYVATAPELEGVSGRYYQRCREKRPSRRALDDATARRLWEASAELAGLPGLLR